jgi:hypothetical protein
MTSAAAGCGVLRYLSARILLDTGEAGRGARPGPRRCGDKMENGIGMGPARTAPVWRKSSASRRQWRGSMTPLVEQAAAKGEGAIPTASIQVTQLTARRHS